MTLSDFLLARIAEDESEARKVSLPVKDGSMLGVLSTMAGAHDTPGSHDGPAVAVVASPSRVLAECGAKRAIVEALALPGDLVSDDARRVADIARALVLGQLASVYADHPDYSDGWRP